MAIALSILTAPLGGSYLAGRGAPIGRYRSFLHHRLQLLPAVLLPGGTPNFSVKGKRRTRHTLDEDWSDDGRSRFHRSGGSAALCPPLPFYQQARSNVPPIIRLSNVGSLYRPWLLAFNVEST
jgi:hypothetical protein